MRSDLFLILAVSLLLTLLLETIFALLCGVRSLRVFMLVWLVNVLTNPPVVLLYTLFPYGWVKLALEIAAFLIEALLYQKYADGIHCPYRFSLGANAFSYFTGALLNRLL